MRMINAEGLKHRVRAFFASENGSRRVLPDSPLRITPQAIEWIIDQEPAVETIPVSRPVGYWIYEEPDYPVADAYYRCSECRFIVGFDINNYCPSCGAYMEAQDDN